MSILLMNVRGYKSKRDSVNEVVEKMKPTVVVLNETQLTGRMKVNIENYKCWTKNREAKGGGGIATGVSTEFAESTMEAGQGEGEEEFLVTRLEAFSPALCVVNCYGEQRRTSKEEVERRWGRLVEVLEGARVRGDHCILTGDLNKLVGCDGGGDGGALDQGGPGHRGAVLPGPVRGVPGAAALRQPARDRPGKAVHPCQGGQGEGAGQAGALRPLRLHAHPHQPRQGEGGTGGEENGVEFEERRRMGQVQGSYRQL